MTSTILLLLFCILEIITPLVVEGIKTFLDGINIKYNATLICLFTSVVLAIGVSAFYMLANNITFDIVSIFYIIALIMANWLGSTLGYDKVKQALTSITDKE